ncbi:MAG: sigma-70 family RNA polymerase sigma factor [Pseudomonadota bacterium]|nr:sigma-70 family RNA polymerase sigma factor [Pseudomonadota bacterium]
MSMQNSECINNPRPQQNYADEKDSELLQFMADGVDAAFDVFSARYLQALNRLVYRLGFSGAESEDMLQDILVHIWQKAHLWTRQEGITARAWIYRVATNLCIDVQRKNKRQPVQNAVDIDMTHAGEDAARTDAQAENSQRQDVIKAALDKLPERNRMALVLVYYQEMSNKEAADSMGVSVKAIEALLVRSRKMLKKHIKSDEVLL